LRCRPFSGTLQQAEISATSPELLAAMAVAASAWAEMPFPVVLPIEKLLF